MDDIEVNIVNPQTSQEKPVSKGKKQQKKESYMQRREKKFETKKKFALGSKFRELNEQDKYNKRQERLKSLNNKQDDQGNQDNLGIQNEPGTVETEQIDPVYEKLTTQYEQPPRQRKKQKPIPEGEFVPTLQFELPIKEDEASGIFTENTFENLAFISPQVKKALAEANYKTLTNIQAKSIPKVYRKKNVIIRSVTGSGKTLAYMVPLYSLLSQRETKIGRENGTLILVVCPTRELAIQCIEVASRCGKRCPYVVYGGLLGGENPKKEKARLRKGVTILIGTPGRVVYHLKNTESFKYSEIQALVFEEWDRLLDMGFKKDIDEIVDCISAKCDFDQVQKILVSAHASPNIANAPSLKITPENYAMIGFEKQDVVDAHRKHKADREDWLGDEAWTVPKTLSQFYTFVWDADKIPFLLAYIIAQRTKKAIIFVATCDEVEFYAHLCQTVQFSVEGSGEKIFQSFNVFKLHGNIDQKTRSKTYFDFRKIKESGVLISTSVASRGLDFPDVSSILLFDPPDGKDDYINKVGRTARIDQHGSSLLVFCDNPNTRAFIEPLSKEMNILPVESSNYFKDFKLYLKQHLRIIEKRPDKHLLQSIKKQVKSDRDTYMMARRAYVSFLRAYGRLQDLNVKQMNLHELSKSFGMERAISTDTKTEKYQKELHRVNREKFRNQGVELNSDIWEQVRKKRRVIHEKELNKLEFV